MSRVNYASFEDWIAREAIPFSAVSPASSQSAIDALAASLDESVELLGFGEAMHGGKDLLLLRNSIFQRLVEAHGFRAIAVESSFPRGHWANLYINHVGPDSYEEVQEQGFSHGFGKLDANRDLLTWMREYNAQALPHERLHFYGFDSPTEMVGTDSPRHTLTFALDYFGTIDADASGQHRRRMEPLLGDDAAWENPQASYEPAKGIGLSEAARALRIATEDLITELKMRQPELVAKSDTRGYREALHYATSARRLLNYHAELATDSGKRYSRLLAIRDSIMADNLAYIVSQERGHGKVFAFAHNSHLQRSAARWQLGSELLEWWSAGSHCAAMLGCRYAIIGSAVGDCDSQGIGTPGLGTLEARMAAAQSPALFIPTHQGQGLPSSEIAALATRSGSTANLSYFPLTAESLTSFDYVAFLNSMN